MPAYVINDMEVTNLETFGQYAQLSPPTVTQYGGRFLVRGGRNETLEGNWSPKRLVVIEFPNIERAKAWLNSPEYAAARRLRQSSAISNMIVVEGYVPA